MASNDICCALCVMAHSLLDRECTAARPTSLTGEIKEALLYQFCNVPNPPTDPWKWLLKWAGDEFEDMTKFVSRFQTCEDDELGFMAALVGSILKLHITNGTIHHEVPYFIPRLEKDIQQRDLNDVAQDVLAKISSGTLCPADLSASYDHPTEMTLNESRLDISNRRLSLSETLHSLTESPAVNKSAKRRRLQSEIVAECEVENAELIKENKELCEKLARAESANERLLVKAQQVDNQNDLEQEVKQLKENLAAEEEKDGRIKKLEREKEALQTRLSKALDEKYQEQCNADEYKKQMREKEQKLGEQMDQNKAKDSQLMDMTFQKDIMHEQLMSLQQQLNESQMPAGNNDSTNNISIASEPPSFSKMISDTPNMMMELEVDRLKGELEQAEQRVKCLETDNQSANVKLEKQKSEVDKINGDLELANVRCSRLQETVTDLTRDKQQVVEELALIKTESTTLKLSNTEILQKFESVTIETNALIDKLQKAEDKIQSRALEIDQLTAQLSDEENRRIKAEDLIIDTNAKFETALVATTEAETKRSQAEMDKARLVDDLQLERRKRMEADKNRAQAESAVHHIELGTKDKVRILREESQLKQDELVSELETIRSQIKEVNQQNEELKERYNTALESKQTEIGQIKEESSALLNQIQIVTQQNATLKEEQKAAVELKEKQLVQIKADAQEQLQTLKEEYNTFIQCRETELTQIKTEKVTELESMRSQFQEVNQQNAELKERDNTARQLESTVAQLQTQVENLIAEKTEITREFESEKANKASIEVRFNSQLQVAVDEKVIIEQEAQNQLKVKDERLRQMSTQFEMSQAKLEEAKQKCNELQEQLNVQVESNKDMLRMNKLIKRQNADYAEKFEELKKTNRAKTDQIKHHEQETTDLKKHFKELQMKSRDLQKRYTERKSELDKVRQEKDALQMELNAEKGRSAGLEAELNQEQLSVTQLKSELQEVTTKNTELESRLAETETSSENEDRQRLTESVLSSHDRLHDTLLNQLGLNRYRSTHVAANHAAGQVADEEDDEDLTMMTAPSIQRLADAANLKSNITKPALHRTTSATTIPKPIEAPFAWSKEGRQDELAKRNQNTKPHLKSSYPMEMDLTPTKNLNSTTMSVSSSIFPTGPMSASTPNRRIDDDFKKPIIDATNKQEIRKVKQTKRRLSAVTSKMGNSFRKLASQKNPVHK